MFNRNPYIHAEYEDIESDSLDGIHKLQNSIYFFIHSSKSKKGQEFNQNYCEHRR